MYTINFKSITGNGTPDVEDNFNAPTSLQIPEVLKFASAQVILHRDPSEMVITIREAAKI